MTQARALPLMEAAGALIDRLAATQSEAIGEASRWCADAISADGLVHMFGTGHSRIPVEEMFPRYGGRLLEEADLIIDLSTPHTDALCTIDGVDTPVGPGSTITAVAIVDCIKVRTARLLMERGALPPVLTRASVVGAERSRELFDDAYREHARRIARAIDQRGGG